MAKRAVRRGVSVVNPMFFIPEDVDELVYDDGNDYTTIGLDDEETGEFEVSVDYFDESDDDTDYGEAPETPQVLGIVPPQEFRVGDSGYEVVDVVFDVSDVYGVDKYEFRVTKI